jgi:predicted small lipoprotein YifL
MRTVKITLLLLLCSALLGACGLKGPLYLPEDKPAAEQAAPADANADKEKAIEKKKDSGGGPATHR